MANEKINGEVLAAITMALHEFQGYTLHVEESGKLTVGLEGTEWSSKLRTQRQLPNKKF